MSGFVGLARDVWYVWVESIEWLCYLLARWSGLSTRAIMSVSSLFVLLAWFVWYLLFAFFITYVGISAQ